MGEVFYEEETKPTGTQIEHEVGHELEHKSLNRKLDWRIIPWIFGIWICSYIDKGNIGVAKINGLTQDLGIATGTKYNVAILVFYITYILVDIPSNLLIKRIPAGIYLPSLIILWGLVTTFTGLIKTYAQLVVIRLLLGIFEGGILGGISVYLAMFYRRSELSWRIGVFYSAAPLSGAFGGLLATEISRIQVGGYNNWPWIFIIEGAITVCYGVICLFFLPNTPAEAKFLNEREKHLAMHRMKEDGHGAVAVEDVREEKFNLHWFWMAFRAPQTLISSLIWIFMLVPLYSYVLFLPTIIKGLGFNNTHAQLLIAPPYFAAFLSTLLSAYYSDRYSARSPILISGIALAAIGYVILLVSERDYTRYGGTFFIPTGLYPASAMIMGWLSNNLAPHYVRATGIGLLIALANLAAFPASFIYLAQDAPRYVIGNAVCLGCSVISLLLVLLLVAYLTWENRRRELGDRNSRLTKGPEDMLGHRHPHFRYKL